MGLSTGTHLGNIKNQSTVLIEGAPYVYFQNYLANELNNPDVDGYYWNLSGTTTYPVYLIGCLQDVSLGENLTVNAVRCDQVGDKDVIQKRNYLEFKFTLTSLLPLSVLSSMLNSPLAPTINGNLEKLGIGKINNNVYYHVYCPKVYDEVVGDLVSITMHRAKFVNAWTINMKAGEPWQVTGLTIWALYDDSKTAGQEFATIIRSDPNVPTGG